MLVITAIAFAIISTSYANSVIRQEPFPVASATGTLCANLLFFICFYSIDVNKKVAKVSIVGAGMQTNAGVAAKMFEALYDENINIRMISTSEIRVTVLIDEDCMERAMTAVHDKFALGAH